MSNKLNNVFRKQLTIILSCIYAVFIVTVGLVIYIIDMVEENTALAEVSVHIHIPVSSERFSNGGKFCMLSMLSTTFTVSEN